MQGHRRTKPARLLAFFFGDFTAGFASGKQFSLCGHTDLPASPEYQDQDNDQHQPEYPHPAIIPAIHPHVESVHKTS
jgi:hypothetical protein